MATARPVVSVYQFDNAEQKVGNIPMPHVLVSPLRPDLVRYIHTNMSKNKRQAQGVRMKAGYEKAAESWGTGRAVARIPRAGGGGTHASGQGAFGNMCRGGGMFAPLKTWRRWHRCVNVTEKRHAVATALAASTLPPLVMAKGHRIGEVAELPLVISNGAESIEKTKEAIEMLKKHGCGEDMQRVIDSKKIRAGKGKARNRRYVMRRGPLVIYNEDNGIVRAMRNIPGVSTANVDRLNLLHLAPGGSFGRFLVWTEGAFKKLKGIYGTKNTSCPLKKGYHLPRAMMENADIARIINSTEVQSVVRPKLDPPKKFTVKKNPLTNKMIMEKLNPGSMKRRRDNKNGSTKGTKLYEKVQTKKKARIAASKKHKTADKNFYENIMKAFEPKPQQGKADGEGEE